jgi:hypothetical protein
MTQLMFSERPIQLSSEREPMLLMAAHLLLQASHPQGAYDALRLLQRAVLQVTAMPEVRDLHRLMSLVVVAAALVESGKLQQVVLTQTQKAATVVSVFSQQSPDLIMVVAEVGRIQTTLPEAVRAV